MRDIDAPVAGYQAGRSLRNLAGEFHVHHRTVADHLELSGIARRVILRKMRPDDVAEAAARYGRSDSLATVAAQFQVDPATLRRELHQAGEPIRPRRGAP